jgi:hypothetical protein
MEIASFTLLHGLFNQLVAVRQNQGWLEGLVHDHPSEDNSLA